MLWLHLGSDASAVLLQMLLCYSLETACFGGGHKSARHRFHRCFTALPLITWFMEDVSLHTVSSCARDVLLPLSIKVQVVTMVWHSLSVCGFMGMALSSWGASAVTFCL